MTKQQGINGRTTYLRAFIAEYAWHARQIAPSNVAELMFFVLHNVRLPNFQHGIQDAATFVNVRDALVDRILDLGFLSHNNKVGIAFYGTVRLPDPVTGGCHVQAVICVSTCASECAASN